MKKLILPFIFFLSFGINVNAQCVADAGPDDVVCGMNYNMQGVLPPGYSGTWTSPNPYVMISMNYSPTTLVYTYQYGTIQLIWTIADSTCTDADTVNITFIQMPYPNAGADASACGNFVTLSAGNDTSMLGYWTGPAGTVFTPDNTTHYCNATILPLNTQQNLSFWWHQYNAYCIDSDEVIITFQPYANSNQVSAGFDGYTCDSVFQLHGIVQGINGSGQWSTNNMNDVIITNALDANTNIAVHPSLLDYGDSSKYTVTMSWTVSHLNCYAVDFVNVTFYQTPHANAGIDFASCGLQGQFDAQPSIAATTGQWSVLASPVGCSNVSYSDVHNPWTDIQTSCYGVYVFMWRETNLYNNQCSLTDTITVEFVEYPTISGGDDQWVCGDTVTLHAFPSGSSAGQLWMESPVTWINYTTHQPDEAAQYEPLTIAQHFHPANDSVIFVWAEYNFATLATASVECKSYDTVIVRFYVNYPAYELVDSWDTVQCGLLYTGFNAEQSAEGQGYWVDNIGTTDFMPDQYDLNASGQVASYGLHLFYWVVRNGVRPNGTSVCVDSSDVIPIRFIEMPVANAGGHSHNWGNGSEIKTDTVCGLKYALDPYITGSPVGQWQTTGWPNRGFVSTNSNTSGMVNDTAFSTIYNSDNPLNPYYEFYWQVDNSVIPVPPYSHGCIDRDTLRITFRSEPFIKGHISYSGGSISGANADLKIFSLDNNTGGGYDTMANTVSIDSSGNYTVTGFPAGHYILKVHLHANAYPGLLNSYYTANGIPSHHWQDATPVTANCGDTIVANIVMYEMQQQSPGSGHISGNIVSAGDGQGGKGVQAGHAKAAGEPVPGAEVYIELEPDDEPISATATDTAGDYGFTGIGNGSYTLRVEIPGFPMLSTYSFTVSASDTLHNNLDFIVDFTADSGYIDTAKFTGIRSADGNEMYISVYPNPLRNYSVAKFVLSKSERVDISFVDITGKTVAAIDNKCMEAGENIIELSPVLRKLNSGIYAMVARIGKIVYVKKIIK